MVHSPAPWNAAAGLCRMDLHALVREVERTWRTEAGIPLRGRGGSDGNTRESLVMLGQICDAVSEVTFTQGMRELSRWARGAKTILGDTERSRQLPIDKTCPFCQKKSLRALTVRGTVICVDPDCHAPDGSRPQARLEYVEATGQFELDWLQ